MNALAERTAVVLSQRDRYSDIPASCIIVDTGSTVDMFRPDMLVNIGPSDTKLHVISTGASHKGLVIDGNANFHLSKQDQKDPSLDLLSSNLDC